VAQLRDLQKARQTKERQDLNDLVKVIEMHESTGKPYDPAADGFVFSQTQINEAIRTVNRERLITEAFYYDGESAAA
jgi:hypothetical protein